jgi:hypothetical protein
LYFLNQREDFSEKKCRFLQGAVTAPRSPGPGNAVGDRPVAGGCGRVAGTVWGRVRGAAGGRRGLCGVVCGRLREGGGDCVGSCAGGCGRLREGGGDCVGSCAGGWRRTTSRSPGPGNAVGDGPVAWQVAILLRGRLRSGSVAGCDPVAWQVAIRQRGRLRSGSGAGCDPAADRLLLPVPFPEFIGRSQHQFPGLIESQASVGYRHPPFKGGGVKTGEVFS